MVFGNISGNARVDPNHTDSAKANIRVQLSNVLFRLTKLLTSHQASTSDITHCTLLVRDMKDFSLINELYAKFFKFTNPPSRVTVAVGDAMPEELEVMLTAIAHPHVPSDRRAGLHVQSQSYWAPANIGPYSQAISVPLEDGYEVHIAGQIPLDPPSMTLYTKDGFKGEALLALQHLNRIGRTQNVKWWVAGVAMIPTLSDDRTQDEQVSLAQAVWRAANAPPAENEDGEDDEAMDAWDRKNFSKAFDDTVKRAPIPDYRVFQEETRSTASSSEILTPPCIVAEVDALPRYASIEWACIGLNVPALQRTYIGGTATESSCSSARQTRESLVRDPDNRFGYTVIEISEPEGVDAAEMLSHVRYGTLYASARFAWEDKRWFKNGISWIPCKRVWGEDGREIRGALVGRSA